MKVVDASAMIDTLTGSSRSDQLIPILEDDLFAPDLLVPEVLAFLRRMAAQERMTDSEANHLAEVFRGSPIEYVHVWPQAARVWDLRHNMSPYDACYVAVAEELGAPLVTTDLRLARAATGVVPVIAI
jgi:predicted nucleic acid-binding protein